MSSSRLLFSRSPLATTEIFPSTPDISQLSPTPSSAGVIFLNLHILRISALTNGRKEVDFSDVMLLKDYLWNHLDHAEKVFGQIDRSILFPMADHLAFAVQRIRNQEQISNPLTEDIRILFHQEYKVAKCAEQLLRERLHG